MNPIAIIRALRPHQWVKNGFVLAAVVFALAHRNVLRILHEAEGLIEEADIAERRKRTSFVIVKSAQNSASTQSKTTDGRTDGRTGRPTDRQTDRQTGR